MAETVGSLVDKLCIAELKLFHMQEQRDRADASAAFRAECEARLGVMRVQRDDLAAELSTLLARIADGSVVPRVYRQFKMYNDPQYRTTPS